MPAAALRLALAAAVLSGAAVLVFEVVWLRMLGLVVGHAVDALTAVLAAFMGGRALGREPRQPAAFFLAGAASWWLGQRDEAGRFFERAVALEPENAEFRGALDRFRRGTLSR